MHRHSSRLDVDRLSLNTRVNARQLLDTLSEMAVMTWNAPTKTQFKVEYFAVTPSGTRTRFTTTQSLSVVNKSTSETAVYAFLKKRHPKADIEILKLEYR